MADEFFNDPLAPDIAAAKKKSRAKPGSFPWDDDKDEAYGTQSQGPERGYKIAYQKPEVAKHVARVLIKNNMDYEAAVASMLKDKEPAATDANIVNVARFLEKAPQVQKALQAVLKDIGLDEEAEKLLVSLAWNKALDKRSRDQIAAIKLLGEWMGKGAKAGENKKPAKLAIEGYEEGLKRMGVEALEDDAPEPELDEGDE